MKSRKLTSARNLLLLIAALTRAVCAQPGPHVEVFSPQGIAKGVRQVRVQFSEPVVPIGDPREQVQPFDVSCAEEGKGRWADGRNWVYDFTRDLPAGARCEFRLKAGLKTLSGREVTGQRTFSFSTGGPAILSSRPWEGSASVDAEQIFILELDAEPIEKSILDHVSFNVDGIRERIGVRIISGETRDKILKAQYPYGTPSQRPLLLIQARRRFPPGTQIRLVWGKGVLSKSGVPTEEDQLIAFQSRSLFTVVFGCQRENAEANCVPLTPMRLAFSAPVAWVRAQDFVIKGPAGKQWKPKPHQEGEEFVHFISFDGPFPPNAQFRIDLPPGLEDDAGRKPSNAAEFPLRVQTDDYPPLAKFSGSFGVLELKTNPVLPVTVRNLEPEINTSLLRVGDAGTEGPKNYSEEVRGRLFKIPPDNAGEILRWLSAVYNRSREDRDVSIFGSQDRARAREFTVPKPNGAKAFEVVGIPMPGPGFYVVELESAILGARLLGQPKPMFVPTTALVTNLAVHLKWGIESSLVWVTALDSGKPVRDAVVQISDCQGKPLWKGLTDGDGVARTQELPSRKDLRHCETYPFAGGLFVTARVGDDMGFVHSTWNDGIEPWRFQLPTQYSQQLAIAHTVFDRTLFRAGETVHMKHLLRRHLTTGFAAMAPAELPTKLLIEHAGSQQQYEFPLKWDAGGVAETEWAVPLEAKLGSYQVVLSKGKDPNGGPLYSGTFQVQQYRVPLMTGVIQFPAEPLLSPTAVPVDLTVKYLAGGGASNLPVRFRHQVQARYVAPFDGFGDFVFANGAVKEGVVRRGAVEEEFEEQSTEREEKKGFELQRVDLTLDSSGSARTQISGLPKADKPLEISAELEFADPNGEIQTVSSRVPLWPASRIVGVKPESWASSKDALKLYAAVVDLAGKPVPAARVVVELFHQRTYSHRKRLVGGFYAYEHVAETKKIKTLCEGSTDAKGLLICESQSPVSGNVVVQATTIDDSGRMTIANRDVWVAGQGQWWFAVEDHDRMDVLPERKRYEPGERAKFQVRMPFRNATALVTVEREGIGEVYIKELSGKEPVVEIPIKGNYAPNVYVSVLAVRGRVSGVQPTASVDLGRPAYKLGVSLIRVGWKAHELKVKVSSDRPVYKVREKAKVRIAVRDAGGKAPPRGSEVALAAVDEGLLELMPNSSWDLLEAMMRQRGYGVETSTAQMHVVGKRHFGLKALPAGGGGGGSENTRELFDTLLLWKGRIPLDSRGEASVEVPLNDSLTSFRIVAVATAGADLFGTGSTTIRSTQDLMILPGIAPLVRQGDRFRSEVTVRNATQRPMQVAVSARVKQLGSSLPAVSFALAAGEAKPVGWDISAPASAEVLGYDIEVKEKDGASDRISVQQKVIPAVPVRTFQATITQLDRDFRVAVERPADAIPGRGGIQVLLRSTLVDGLQGVADYMRGYGYTCLEQKVSRAVALRDEQLWKGLMTDLPSYLDSDGLAKYFPSMGLGSDALTSYLLAISHEAGWEIPAEARKKMEAGLEGFVQGRITRYFSLPTADLSIRKLTAVEALSRRGSAAPELLSSISVEPNLWPTSAVLDWFNALERIRNLPNRDTRLREAEQILRSRLEFQGTSMGFSTESGDRLWWLMVSGDTNAVRLTLSLLEAAKWREDLPRVVRGAIGRQRRGHWDLTTANAWGVLAVEKFSRAFEKDPVSGASTATLAGRSQPFDWSAAPKGGTLTLGWPSKREELAVSHAGTGKPWLTVQSLAAIPLRQPLSAGFKIKKSLSAVEQKRAGEWSRGDIVRVRLQVESQADRTWVVLSDPIPGGATILGSGLGRDSSLATREEKSEGWVWPAFQERSFETFRAYYEYVPKGQWIVEYTLRLNNDGIFHLPPTRVEAMYSPEMFAELPNVDFKVVRD